jgi:hypothetical protein
MFEMCSRKKEASRLRTERATKNRALDYIRRKKLIETKVEDFFAVLKAGGVFVHHLLRCLHNLALGIGWLLAPVIPPKLWPKMEKNFGVPSHRKNINASLTPKTTPNGNCIIKFYGRLVRRKLMELI